MVFENYKRSEASLIATMVQMVIAGVSTRKVEKVVETLCGTSFSKSTVSELCKRLDSEIHDFNNRSLEMTKYPFLMVDATYFKVREDHRIKSKAFFVALGFRSDGYRGYRIWRVWHWRELFLAYIFQKVKKQRFIRCENGYIRCPSIDKKSSYRYLSTSRLAKMSGPFGTKYIGCNA